MLRDLDYKLIEREEKIFSTNKVKVKLIPILECDKIQGINDLFSKYNLLELSLHFYDASPEICDNCKKIECSTCPTWEKYQGTEAQLSFNNYTDVYGPGIWKMDQKRSNEMAKSYLQNISKDEDFSIRTFYYEPNKDEFNIFYYNRDREFCDYWFVFKRK